ncbi:MAG: phosphoribosyl-AMP cyclohydrolase [Hyphomonadaceae bacterium]
MANIFSPPLFSATEQNNTKELRPRFNAAGLITVITQDANSGEVLMLAWMNQQALSKTIKTGKATYWSRSRKKLWIKGATSGNTQQVVEMRVDCDQDAILMKVNQTGGACHTDRKSCFYREITDDRLLKERETG